MDATLPITEDWEIGLDAEPRAPVELPGSPLKLCPRVYAAPTIDHLFRLSMGRFRILGFAPAGSRHRDPDHSREGMRCAKHRIDRGVTGRLTFSSRIGLNGATKTMSSRKH